MTEKIYYENPYCRDFQATIEDRQDAEGRTCFELSRTCFYPEGGGQPCDLGELEGIEVNEVVERNGKILHYLETARLSPGQSVAGRIDWKRRFDHMQQHTGQHILSQSFFRLLEADTESFHLGPQVATIDLSLQSLELEDLYRVEDLANQFIFEDREIKVHSIDAASQSEYPIRSPSTRVGRLRVVEIVGCDFSPCGGTHCNRTGEIGLVKIRKWEKVRKHLRVEFLCGGRALRDYRWKNRALYQLSKLYSTGDQEVVEAAERQFSQQKKLRKEIRGLNEKLLGLEAEELLESSTTNKGVRIVKRVWEEGDLKNLQVLASRIAHGGENRVVLFGLLRPSPTLLFLRSSDLPKIDLRDWVADIAPIIEGRGGGTAERIQLGGQKAEGVEEAVKKAASLVQVVLLK